MEYRAGTGVVEVAVCAAAAAHRRDHRHRRGAECHPHLVEVIHLGLQAPAACHDCGADSGFRPRREAERLAVRRRQQTRTTTVAMPGVAAA